ncbi:MAG: alkaline phosphatase D family protein, partial [Sedimentisphaerales bacterium]
EWKIPVWRTFINNWNNPYYGGGETQPGCWFDFSIGDVDFFMLDSRYYRDKPQSENPSMLGAAQKKWLFEKLKSSKATFKVLASPVPWAMGATSGSRDPWQGYKAEREQIFSFLESNRIDGVILISADRHRSDAWKIERENEYDLYEFESSKLTNIHTHKIMPGALFGYNQKCSFGLLTFDTMKTDPEVTYQIINIDDEVIWKLSLKKSQLTHGKTE